MKIALLGAGNVGSPLARAFAAAGHSVNLANSRDPETIRELARSLGATATWAADAVNDVDVVITSVPPLSLAKISHVLSQVPDDVPVIDTGNYHPARDGRIPALDDGEPEAVWTSAQLGRPVVKAWNAVLAQTLEVAGMPAGAPGRIALPIAGDDAKGLEIAKELTDVSGFDPLVFGGLADAWRAQPGTAAYCTELPLAELQFALDHADRSAAAVRRDISMSAFRTFVDVPDRRASIVRFHRAVTLTPDPH